MSGGPRSFNDILILQAISAILFCGVVVRSTPSSTYDTYLSSSYYTSFVEKLLAESGTRIRLLGETTFTTLWEIKHVVAALIVKQ